MSSPTLTPVSYVVLGLVGRAGTATPYELKRWVAESIGNFWAFPHSQLYAEAARLAADGLLEETREQAGRRRRTYALTEPGEAALRRWLREPASERTQIRDLALLKLFFGQFASRDDIVALARVQEAEHRARLERYQAVDVHLSDHEQAEVEYARVTLRMGILCEEAFVRFWSELAARPPGAAARRAGRGRSRTS